MYVFHYVSLLVLTTTLTFGYTTARVVYGSAPSGGSQLRCQCTCEQANNPGRDVYLSGNFMVNSKQNQGYSNPGTQSFGQDVYQNDGPATENGWGTTSLPPDTTYTFTEVAPNLEDTLNATTNSQTDQNTTLLNSTIGASASRVSATGANVNTELKNGPNRNSTMLSSSGTETNGIRQQNGAASVKIHRGNHGQPGPRRNFPRRTIIHRRMGPVNRNRSRNGPGGPQQGQVRRNGPIAGQRKNAATAVGIQRRQMPQMVQNGANNNFKNRNNGGLQNVQNTRGGAQQTGQSSNKSSSPSADPKTNQSEATAIIKVSARDQAIIDLIKSLADRNRAGANSHNSNINNNNRRGWSNAGGGGGGGGGGGRAMTTSGWYQGTTSYRATPTTTPGYNGGAGPSYGGFGISGPFGMSSGFMGLGGMGGGGWGESPGFK